MELRYVRQVLDFIESIHYLCFRRDLGENVKFLSAGKILFLASVNLLQINSLVSEMILLGVLLKD